MTEPEFRELPTPQPLMPASADEASPLEVEPSFLERLLGRRKLLVVLVAAGLIVAILSVILILMRPPGGDDLVLEKPPSLEDLSQQYPELADLFADPTLGSVYKEFLVAYESGGVEAAKDLAAQRGLLNDRNEVRITLVLDNEQYVAPVVEELSGVGITVEGSYKERINIGVPLVLIEQLAQQTGIDALFERLTQMEHIVKLELPTMRRSDAMLLVPGEGVSLTGADRWHTAGWTGESIRVGVLDLGFDGYRALLGSDLPEQVVAASFVYGTEPDGSGEVHGTACAEIVHEMAPGAELYFAYYDGSTVSMGQAVDWLMAQGVHIISNSTTGVVGPMDGTEPDAEMVDDVVRRGVLWVNSAGNSGMLHYRGEFEDSDGDAMHEFPDATEAMILYAYGPDVTIALNWNDWQSVREDYDLYLFDESGELMAAAEDIQDGTPGQYAAEVIALYGIPEGTYLIQIRGHAITQPGILDLYVHNAEIEFPVAEHSLCSPADAAGALAVGATEYRDDSLAAYSSQGPSNDGRLKPDMSAPAGVSSASYAPDVFDGTSASTPHVAGAAALVWSAFPDYTVDQVRQYLQNHALDLGPAGPDNAYGYGRLRLPDPPSASVEVPVIPTPLPTLALVPTQVPVPTAVAIVVEPGEEAAPGVPAPEIPAPEKPAVVKESLWILGALGLLGALVAVSGGALLVLALRRPALPRIGGYVQPPAPGVPGPTPTWPPPTPEVPGSAWPPTGAGAAHDYGVLVVAGRLPVPLKPGPTALGRAFDNDMVLDSVLVSRRHARIVCRGSQCLVEDLNSANGVFVNQRRVSSAVLAPGDQLRLGDVELAYQAAGTRTATPGRAPAAAVAGPWIEVGGRRYPLSPAGTTIGRSHDNDITIPDTRASRYHARIDLQQGAFVISDLGSANGVLVNGQRVQQQALHEGDEVTIGDTHLYFRAAGGR
ncbi:MAG: FHA domain-containing protein [Anaerolineae bacterium]|nr:FHA domain-containing protein [Anaerolineae bacterium]